jgi:hypothetical protein
VAGILAQLIALNPSATGASVRSAAESMATTGVLGGLDGGSPNRLAYLNPNLTVTESLNVGLTSGSTPFVVTHSVAEGTARVSFERVTTAGTLSISQAQSPPATGMTGAQLVTGHYEITASGVQFARAEVCLPYRPADLSALGRSANELRLIRFTGSSGRTDITSRIVTSSNQVCGFTTSFSPFGIGYYNTSRIQGADRYVTASQIAQREYAGPVPVVYLASGERFPDALAAAPAAVAEGGPVLLTRAGELPTSTREQLQRLAPSRVVIVGGTGAISAAVASAVQTAVPSATVTRRFGDTRYETAAAVSANLFTPGVVTGVCGDRTQRPRCTRCGIRRRWIWGAGSARPRIRSECGRPRCRCHRVSSAPTRPNYCDGWNRSGIGCSVQPDRSRSTGRIDQSGCGSDPL